VPFSDEAPLSHEGGYLGVYRSVLADGILTNIFLDFQ
jgi:hypothetical protein